MEVQYEFMRYEKKFLLTRQQYEMMLEALQQWTRIDEYGLHTICSIYYDTEDYAMVRRSIERPVYKEKLRMRSYGTPQEDGYVFAEIKKKYKGIVYKRRVGAGYRQMEAFLSGQNSLPDHQQIQREIQWVLRQENLKPKVLVAYDRIAMEEMDGLRITFDTNMRWRKERLDLRMGSDGLPILPEERIVMELKTMHAIPFRVARLLSESHIYPSSFSKYGTCYMRYILPELHMDKITGNQEQYSSGENETGYKEYREGIAI